MKNKIKLFLIPFMLLATLFFVTACSQDPTAYDNNDGNGYTVSVKYDANGGVFIGTSSIMVDSFNIADMQKDSSGMVNLKLMDPTDKTRGDWEPANGSLVLAGWYKERTESTDSEGKKVYTYSGKFNFETDVVTVDPSKNYTSADPVLTLYACWIPKLEVRFLNMEGEVIETYAYNPMTDNYTFDPTNPDVEIKVPVWSEGDEGTGRLDMFEFPEILGKTFEAAYYDKEGTRPVVGKVDHPGDFKEATGELENSVVDVYVKYTEGNWYHIYNAKQLSTIADPTGHYVLYNDLDFAEVDWPASFTRQFSGEIVGNGKTIKNVTIKQNKLDRAEFGLFGAMAKTAKISDVTFENITASIEAGTRITGAAFGLFAASIHAETTVENVKIINSKLVIAANCHWGTKDYAIGLICGSGSTNIDHSGITCEVTGEGSVTTVVVDDKGFVTLVSG